MLRDELARDTPPALIASVDGEPAGWVRIGPRPAQRRIARTRMIVRSTAEPLDDDSVWAVTCFVVRREHRGRGLTARLLDAAVSFAADRGARVIEGYPIDTAVGSHPANDLYHGVLSVFLAAGFRESARPAPDRPLVTLRVADRGTTR